MNGGQNIEGAASEQNNTAQQPFAEHNYGNTAQALVPNEQSATNKQNHATAKTSNQITTDNRQMEVHHPHHLTHKKKWSEYILEFLMLFFAVFLGFLVENYREHMIEEGRAERHMHTMVENLKYDTTRMQSNLRGNLRVGRGLDSFRFQINEAIQGRVNANRLYYYYWKYGRGFGGAVVNDAALSQLKSSGMLRMIKNDALLNEMGDYYERRVTAMINGRTGAQKRLDELNDTYKLFFSFQGFDEILQRDTVFSVGNTALDRNYNDILAKNPPLKLINSAPADFERLYNDVAAFELAIRNYNSFIRYGIQGADSLMRHINQEYNFDH